jgi:hypothetical protein
LRRNCSGHFFLIVPRGARSGFCLRHISKLFCYDTEWGAATAPTRYARWGPRKKLYRTPMDSYLLLGFFGA